METCKIITDDELEKNAKFYSLTIIHACNSFWLIQPLDKQNKENYVSPHFWEFKHSLKVLLPLIDDFFEWTLFL